MELLQTLIIPQYQAEVQISKSQQKKFYKKKRGGFYPRKLPKTYRDKLANGLYSIGSDGLVLNEKGQPILANPGKAGKPKIKKLNGNEFASGFSTHFIRAKLVNAMKDFYRPIVREQMIPFQQEDYPLWVDWHLYTTIKPRLFDLTNMWFYWKYLEDCLFETEDPDGHPLDPIIPDDNIKYITKPATAPIFHPIDNWEDRKFIFYFYKDDREEFNNFELWKNTPH